MTSFFTCCASVHFPPSRTSTAASISALSPEPRALFRAFESSERVLVERIAGRAPFHREAHAEEAVFDRACAGERVVGAVAVRGADARGGVDDAGAAHCDEERGDEEESR